MLNLPKIIGHRGACGYAPENTLESIRTAADMGLKWVELDVKLTRDAVPILFHDETLDRTTNGTGIVAETNWDDIEQLESGSWFSPGFTGTKIASLEEAIELLIELDLGFNLELKPCPGREVETAEVALDLLSRFWDDTKRLLLSSFQHVSLETAQNMAPDYARGLLLDDKWPENWPDLATYLEVATININGNTCSREDLHALSAFKKPILAYTINDPQRARVLQGWGVSTLFTDVPDVIQDALIRTVV